MLAIALLLSAKFLASNASLGNCWFQITRDSTSVSVSHCSSEGSEDRPSVKLPIGEEAKVGLEWWKVVDEGWESGEKQINDEEMIKYLTAAAQRTRPILFARKLTISHDPQHTCSFQIMRESSDSVSVNYCGETVELQIDKEFAKVGNEWWRVKRGYWIHGEKKKSDTEMSSALTAESQKNHPIFVAHRFAIPQVPKLAILPKGYVLNYGLAYDFNQHKGSKDYDITFFDGQWIRFKFTGDSSSPWKWQTGQHPGEHEWDNNSETEPASDSKVQWMAIKSMAEYPQQHVFFRESAKINTQYSAFQDYDDDYYYDDYDEDEEYEKMLDAMFEKGFKAGWKARQQKRSRLVHDHHYKTFLRK